MSELMKTRPLTTGEWYQQQIDRAKTQRFVLPGVGVTPELATIMLESNEDNRYLSPGLVRRYATEMRAGRWMENGESIKIAVDGTMNDGQHRAHAVVLANLNVIFDIAFGLDRESRMSLDQGKRRTAGDLIGMAGVINGPVHSIASSIRALLTHEAIVKAGQQRVGPKFTSLQIAQEAVRFPGIETCVKRGRKIYDKIGTGVPPSLIGAMIYLTDRVDVETSLAFWHKLETGIGIEDKTDPLYHLRERYNEWSKTRTKTHEYDVMAVTFKAWNSFYLKVPMKQLRFADKEAFPEID